MLCAVDFCVPHRARAAPGLGKTLGAVAFDDELYCVFTEDVFCFFDLSTRDTDLKKKLYSETPEYARQLAKLRDLKKKAISTNYFIQISTDISNAVSRSPSRQTLKWAAPETPRGLRAESTSKTWLLTFNRLPLLPALPKRCSIWQCRKGLR
jgi:hypothetical protein